MLPSRVFALGILFFTLAWLGYDHYRPWVNFHSEALALCAIGLLAISQCFRRDAVTLIAPRIVWVVFAVAFIPWAQYLLGISLFAGDAVVTCLYLCALTTAIWLGYGYALDSTGTNCALTGVFFMLWVAALASAAIYGHPEKETSGLSQPS